MKAKFRKKLGQNTSEYLIMLTLVAVGSITILTTFGKQIKSQFAWVSASMTGETPAITAAKDQKDRVATEALNRSKKEASMNIKADDMKDAQN